MKIALAQINPTIGAFDQNVLKIRHFADRAIKDNCDLIVFSEMALTGYPPKDLLEKKDFILKQPISQLINEIKDIGVICGWVEYSGDHLYNTAVLFENAQILHKSYKRLLPVYDVFDERRYFTPGNECDIIHYKGHNIGLTICEDIWNDSDFFGYSIYELDPVREMIQKGADCIINISASPFHLGKCHLKKRMLETLSQKYNVPFIYVNQVGGNDSIIFDGHSMVYDRTGQIVARAKDFEEDLIFYDTNSQKGLLQKISNSDEETLFKALALGTRDYLHKCGFQKVIIGLSGGIDSALTTAIAVEALGHENVRTVYMPSAYTSKDNGEDTEKLAENYGIKRDVIPIDSIFDNFLTILPQDFDRNSHDLAEQNLQARIRGTILMAFSNKYNSLVLTTGNKSEIAVGYCTLYGDMNGALSVISDLPKAMVYTLSKYINRNKELIPNRIINKAPSAELKPDQKDQDDLPEYSDLDKILKAYIEDNQSVDSIVNMGFNRKLVLDIIRRIYQNEYKRQQAPTGLKVTSKAFGEGRRYPIAHEAVF
ncbi:NH(3)-dependent NAD(+) synthetase [Candidatus Magnetomorum sp. HK-1]|nr:NH(3)-dependent NAD(+) synthetase [Candidatus Magnetomorum sp. HK-1]